VQKNLNFLRILGLVVGSFFASTLAYSFQPSQKALNGLAGLYSYLSSQDLALRRIEQKFPEYGQAVHLAKLEFDSVYPTALEKTKEKIVQLLGDGRGEDLIKTLDKNIEAIPNSNNTTTAAINFLQTVANRSKGSIERENIKSFLHAIVFHERPEAEMVDRFSRRFSTAGEPKAKGLEVSVRVPQSWEEREGNTPNTIRSWTSDAGTGLSELRILIQDFGDRRTKEQIQRAIARKEYDGLLPKGAVVKKIQPTQSSNRYGWYADYEMVLQRVDMELFLISRNVTILHEGKRIEIGCASGGLISKKEEIQAEASRVESLCRAFLASLVIDSVFK
jgi:hypothetical protein